MDAIDIPHLVREGGDELEAQALAEGVLRFWVRKGGAG
jgi:TusA-related sulfurtransferase